MNSGGINVKFNNLIEDGSCSPFLSGNPGLGILKNNGGTTKTHALIAGSIAIDGGDNAYTVGLLFDQRGSGFDRIVNGTVDIGAFEVQPTSVPESSSLIPLVVIALGGFSRRQKPKPNSLCSETLQKLIK
ncbi:choice-of-anchor Q domain-containing protein [Crocosphaera sp.]|uniref:choice-of-anchor Q domain-containing protein n=1 Tax=Crocosphaera sp. TaxID=2729996 RepID=UPI00260FBDF9|nr:choice-of-anchor Q domain-containing protein [Crocosphaera sp.]MDJ0583451.1 choice-of-anchor Q domain-containing protein [Crocosphaera sp.]